MAYPLPLKPYCSKTVIDRFLAYMNEAAEDLEQKKKDKKQSKKILINKEVTNFVKIG